MAGQIPLRRNIIDIVWTFSRQFASALMQLGQMLILAKVLGPEGTGAYAVALLLPSLMSQIFNMGLASANVYYLSSHRYPLAQIWAASRDLILLMAVLGLALGAAIILVGGATLFPGVPRTALLTALLIFPTSLITGVTISFFMALQDFRAYNTGVLIQPAIAFIGTCLLWLAGQISLLHVLFVVVFSHALALVLALVLLGKRTPLGASSTSSKSYLRDAVAYGMKAYVGNMLAFLNYRLDLFLVNLLVGPEGAGIYSIAVRLSEQLWMISQATKTVIFPRLSAMVNDDEGKKRFTQFMARLVLWSTLAGALLLAAISKPLIALLFGPAFSDANMVLNVLLPGLVLFACAQVLSNDLASRGRVDINLYLAGLVLIINTGANLALIPLLGIVGAATATTIAYSVVLVLYLGVQNRLNQLLWWECIFPTKGDMTMLRSVLSR